jgi:hypothetical protein
MIKNKAASDETIQADPFRTMLCEKQQKIRRKRVL